MIESHCMTSVKFFIFETGKGSLSKVVRRVRNYLNHSFYNDWIGTYGVISISCNSIILRIFFLLFFSFFLCVTKAFWSNETGKGCLSKVVRRVRNYLNLRFYNNWIGTYGVISISYNGIILRIFFLLFFTFFFVSMTKAFWSNETGKGCLSKVVRMVRNYLNSSFYNDWKGTYGVISIFCDDIILRTFLYLLFCIKFYKGEIGKGCCLISIFIRIEYICGVLGGFHNSIVS